MNPRQDNNVTGPVEAVYVEKKLSYLVIKSGRVCEKNQIG